MNQLKFAKPKPRLLDKRVRENNTRILDRVELEKCHTRSDGRCEVRLMLLAVDGGEAYMRCWRRASQNHHLIGGSGRRNKGKSILAEHRIDTCTRCHEEITNHIMVPVDGTKRELASEVRYERIR